MKLREWKVFLNDKYITSVFFEKGCSHSYVKKSLIEHDGYNPNIKVVMMITVHDLRRLKRRKNV